MTDRLRSEAELVAAQAQPDAVRGPWLEYNARLIDLLNEMRLSQQEILRLLAAQNNAITASIASAFREYAAGDELHRAANEADALARDVRLQGQITTLVAQRATDHERLHTHIAEAQAAMLEQLAQLAGRQARLAKHVDKESD